MDGGELAALLGERPGSVDAEDLGFPQVLHANAAAVIARERCGVEDQEVLDAIRHHPTGRPGPSPVMLVLLAADYTEPTRDFDGVDSMRQLVRADLRGGVREILRRKVQHVRATGRPVHCRTRAALDSLQE
jgi:predicted HD superfamily hydrolase involved in NAD metabolism